MQFLSIFSNSSSSMSNRSGSLGPTISGTTDTLRFFTTFCLGMDDQDEGTYNYDCCSRYLEFDLLCNTFLCSHRDFHFRALFDGRLQFCVTLKETYKSSFFRTVR